MKKSSPLDLSSFGTVTRLSFNTIKYTQPTMFFNGGLYWDIKTVELTVESNKIGVTIEALKKGESFFFFETLEAGHTLFEGMLCEVIIESILFDVNSKGDYKVFCKVRGMGGLDVSPIEMQQ